MAQVLRVEDEASHLLALDALDESLRRLSDDVLRIRRRCAEVRTACQLVAETITGSGWSRSAGDPSLERLSRRERLVAALVAEGRSNSQVAAELHVSMHTVKSQMRSLLRKLEISSRWQLASRIAASAE